jgi:hypothetical protein
MVTSVGFPRSVTADTKLKSGTKELGQHLTHAMGHIIEKIVRKHHLQTRESVTGKMDMERPAIRNSSLVLFLFPKNP